MKLGVMAALFNGRPLEEVAAYCAEIRLDAIELPVGAYPGATFFDPAKVLASKKEQDRIKGILKEHDLTLSGLAVHGNPVHPDPKHAAKDHRDFVNAVKLAPALGTDIVITFSGCPGGSKADRTPNWVTCAWPPDYREILDYQWEKVLIPYWSTQARLCAKMGVKVAWEAHPGFCVYNPDTLIRLSRAAMKASGLKGKPVLGANLDPSHFFWQGIDPIEAARARRGGAPLLLPREGHRAPPVGGPRERLQRRASVHRPPVARVELPHLRLRPRARVLEALRLDAAPLRVRPCPLDRARGCADVGRGGPRARGGVPLRGDHRGAGWQGVVVLNRGAGARGRSAAPASGVDSRY